MTNKYYQKHKERIWKEARERYYNLSEEEKSKKKGPRKISKSFGGTKAETTWVYEKLLLAHKK